MAARSSAPHGCIYAPLAVNASDIPKFIARLDKAAPTPFGQAGSALGKVPKLEFYARGCDYVVHDFGQPDKFKPFGEDCVSARMPIYIEHLRKLIAQRLNFATNHCTLLKFEDGTAHSVEPRKGAPGPYVVYTFCADAPRTVQLLSSDTTTVA